MKKVFVSSCLIWKKCRYDANDKLDLKLLDLLGLYEIIDACPEQLGWLNTPRLKAEIIWNKVINENWIDETDKFLLWATKSYKIYETNNCSFAVLKSKSPSCWCWMVYDWSFSWKLIEWDWIFAKILKDNNQKVYTEETIKKLEI